MIDLSNPFPFGLDKRNWPLFLGGFVVLLAVLVVFDHPFSLMATSHTPSTLDLANQVTRWGKSDWILIPSGVLLIISGLAAWLMRGRLVKLAIIEMTEVFALIFVGVGLPSLVAAILKRLIGRSRPVVFDQIGTTLGFHPVINTFGFQGWPSGHTTTAFAAAMVLGFLAPRWFWAGLLYACAIAASRLVLGAHYPTDVVSGAALGSLGAYTVRYWFATRRWGVTFRPDGHIVQRPIVAMTRLVRRR